MKVYMSYLNADRDIARKLGERLRTKGLSVWDPETEIYPGDNWAKSMGKALESSDAMVVIVSPESAANELIRRDISFAMNSERYAWRLIPVFTPSMNLNRSQNLPVVFDRLHGVKLNGTTDRALTAAIDEISQLFDPVAA